jgi:two-component system, NtrC family, response regulator HydG
METERADLVENGPPGVIVAERDESLRMHIAARLFREGFEVAQAWDSESLTLAITQVRARLLLLDLELPEHDPLRFLPEMRTRLSSVPVIILANGSPAERVARAIECGALEAVRKPVDLESLAARVVALIGPGKHAIPRLQGAVWSEVTHPTLEAIKRAAGRDATVLITGETGSGKEVAARTIHELSPRRAEPFVAVNCAALSAGLLESELFGHEKGAFTGADKVRAGRFELADKGTILLDEIAEIAPTLQAKLLRVLQERTYERVGSSDVLRSQARIIATTNRDLAQEVKLEKFRKDLFYRLHVLPIEMPPLRMRPDEIPLLMEHFFIKKRPGVLYHIHKEVLSALLKYSWPGNVRELENLVELWCSMEGGPSITIDHVPAALRKVVADDRGPRADMTLREVVRDAERLHLERILAQEGWSQRRASEVLGISRTTLQKKMAQHGLVAPTQTPIRLAQ